MYVIIFNGDKDKADFFGATRSDQATCVYHLVSDFYRNTATH